LNLPEKDVLEQNLAELRMMYEPHVHSLSRFLHIPLPSWLPKAGYRDNWQTTPWGAVTDAKKKTHPVLDREDHF
jgi:hypothetical protein